MLATTTYACELLDVGDFLSQHTHVAVDVGSLLQSQNLVLRILQEGQGKAEQHLSNKRKWKDWRQVLATKVQKRTEHLETRE